MSLRSKSTFPRGYVFASGDEQNTPGSLLLNIAMVKPPSLLQDFVPDSIRVDVTYRCLLTAVSGG